MQSVVGNVVAFRVHAPCSGALLLDIFANAVTPQEYLTGEPMKFKSVCKFKIMCEDLHTVMVPLPGINSNPKKVTQVLKMEIHILPRILPGWNALHVCRSVNGGKLSCS